MRPVRAAAAFLGHVFLGFLVMVAIWATEQGFKVLFHDESPKFFDICPVKYFFDAGKPELCLSSLSSGYSRPTSS
jgi:hypothetical protein